MKSLVIIPARGGSKGIPRKNIRYLNGKPLIAYTIETAKKSRYVDKIVVTTDDKEIERIAKTFNVEVIIRPPHLATDEVPLDPVIYHAVEKLERNGYFFENIVTIQPTSPLLKVDTLDKIIKILIEGEYETILTAVDDRHLSWTKVNKEFIPNFKERTNRQYLQPEYRETGAVMATKRYVLTPNNRIGKKVTLFEVDKYESIDIDSPLDWWVAEKIIKRKRVIIRVDGYKEIGLGHIYRALTLAENMMDHEIIFLMNQHHSLGIDLVNSHNYRVVTFSNDPVGKIKELGPDIVINDILDTSKEYILALKEMGIRVFNFEDLGDGAEFADGVFNALYPSTVPSDKFYTGEKFYCARSEFLNSPRKKIKKDVNNVLITFGGTDPNNLTLKTLKAINKSSHNFNTTIILGSGYLYDKELNIELKEINKKVNVFKKVDNMAEYMYNADIIFSSAGRTMYEIAIIGTPAIIIAQNYREMTHLFGHNYNGFVNLGIHHEVTDSTILKAFNRVVEDFELRKVMNKRMLSHDLKNGINRVLGIIFNDDNN